MLLRLGWKDKFEYQSTAMGGRLDKGGAVIDFYIGELSLGINVTSRYWHYETSTQRMVDELQRVALEGMGIRLIFI